MTIEDPQSQQSKFILPLQLTSSSILPEESTMKTDPEVGNNENGQLALKEGDAFNNNNNNNNEGEKKKLEKPKRTYVLWSQVSF